MTENLYWSVWSILYLSYCLHITPVLCPLVPLSPCQSEDGRSQLYEYYFCCTDFNFIAFRAQICILQTCTFLCLVLVLTFYVSHLSEALSAKSASLWHLGAIVMSILIVKSPDKYWKPLWWSKDAKYWRPFWRSNYRDDDHCIADWEVQHRPIRIKNFGFQPIGGLGFAKNQEPNIENLSDGPMIAMMIIALRIGRSSIASNHTTAATGGQQIHHCECYNVLSSSSLSTTSSSPLGQSHPTAGKV